MHALHAHRRTPHTPSLSSSTGGTTVRRSPLLSRTPSRITRRARRRRHPLFTRRPPPCSAGGSSGAPRLVPHASTRAHSTPDARVLRHHSSPASLTGSSCTDGSSPQPFPAHSMRRPGIRRQGRAAALRYVILIHHAHPHRPISISHPLCRSSHALDTIPHRSPSTAPRPVPPRRLIAIARPHVCVACTVRPTGRMRAGYTPGLPVIQCDPRLAAGVLSRQ